MASLREKVEAELEQMDEALRELRPGCAGSISSLCWSWEALRRC